MATEARVTAVIEAQDKASSVLNSIANNFKSFSGVSLGVAGAIATVGVGLTKFVSASLTAAATMEQTQVAFGTMLGSAEKANVLIKDLVNFAKTTPFELSNLNIATKQLLAYGFAQEEIIPNLKALGNIAAGVGMDKLPNLILAFGQVRAATKLTGMELRQFTEAGVPLLDTLAKNLNKPVAEIQKMVSDGAIGFKDVQTALMSLSEEGGRFNNLMEKQSHTLSGAISNLQDSWNIFLTGAGMHFINWARDVVMLGTQLLNWINGFGSSMSSLMGKIEQSTGLISLFKYEWERIVTTFNTSLLPALKELWLAMQPLMPFLKALAQVIGVTVVGVIVLLAESLTLTIQGFTELLAVGAQVITFFEGLWAKTIGKVIDQIANLINMIKEAVTWLGKLSLSGVGSTISTGFNSAIGSVKNLLSFDKGGIVPGPVGSPQLAIVHSGERVIPLGGDPGGVTVNITGNTISSSLDVRDIAMQVSEELMRTLRRSQQI